MPCTQRIVISVPRLALGRLRRVLDRIFAVSSLLILLFLLFCFCWVGGGVLRLPFNTRLRPPPPQPRRRRGRPKANHHGAGQDTSTLWPGRPKSLPATKDGSLSTEAFCQLISGQSTQFTRGPLVYPGSPGIPGVPGFSRGSRVYPGSPGEPGIPPSYSQGHRRASGRPLSVQALVLGRSRPGSGETGSSAYCGSGD